MKKIIAALAVIVACSPALADRRPACCSDEQIRKAQAPWSGEPETPVEKQLRACFAEFGPSLRSRQSTTISKSAKQAVDCVQRLKDENSGG